MFRLPPDLRGSAGAQEDWDDREPDAYWPDPFEGEDIPEDPIRDAHNLRDLTRAANLAAYGQERGMEREARRLGERE